MKILYVDAQRCETEKDFLTGQEIKQLADVNPNYPVYQDVFKTPKDDIPIGDNERVAITKEPVMHFYTLIPASHRSV